MSRHGHNAEIHETKDNTVQRSHSHHSHLHLHPTAVIDHLKRKVKHKRSEKYDSSVLSDGASSRNTNGDININDNKRSNQNHEKLVATTSLISPRDRSNTTPNPLSKKKSSNEYDNDDNDNNHVSIENGEQDSTVRNQINADEDIEESMQWQTTHTSSDVGREMIKSKPKFIKATKSPSEISSLTYNKRRRRQAVRRTVFQIRDGDFNSIFRDLPSDEQLVIAFPCAWRKDIFVHGRMFLSVNYFSFYTCFLKWEESLCIPYKDIISITREKSIKVVSNAIKIRTKNQEHYVFASFISREKVFYAIFRLWQNIQLEQSLDYEQLRALVYSDQQNNDESTGGSEESLILENTGDGASESGIQSKSLPVTSDRSTEPPKRPKKPLRRGIVSLPASDNESITYLPTCTCESHLAKTYADRIFTFSVDKLFELICGDNSFTRDFHNSQKLTDYTIGEWRLNNDTGKRERQVTYKTVSQSMLGTNTLSCRENQILEGDIPHSMYILSTEVYNEGMKYTDAFYVATRFCMVQRDAERSSLRVTAEIKYVKTVNLMIRTFIEKNSNTYIENGVNEQVRRLENQQTTQVNRKSNVKSISPSKQDVRKPAANKNSQNQIESGSLENINALQETNIPTNERTITGKGTIYDIGLFIGISLLLLHIYLCYKLYYIDHLLLTRDAICLNQCKQTCLDNKSHP